MDNVHISTYIQDVYCAAHTPFYHTKRESPGSFYGEGIVSCLLTANQLTIAHLVRIYIYIYIIYIYIRIYIYIYIQTLKRE